MHKIAFLFFLLWNMCSYTQVEEVKRIVHQLTSPEFRGRGYVQKGDSIASAYIAEEFKKIGLVPPHKSYFQEFTHAVNTFPGKMIVVADDDTLTPGEDYLVDPSCPSVKLILHFRQITPAEATNKDLLQKTIAEVVNSGHINTFLLDMRKVSADTMKLLKDIPELLAAYSHTVVWTNQKLTWSVASEQSPYTVLQISGNVLLKNEIHVNIEAEKHISYSSRNVIGYLSASRRTKRTIVLCAHYDHLGMMGAETYFPGANDNASGTATMIAVAKELSLSKRHCNYLFIAFAGEEAGLVGSRYFVEHPLLKLNKIRFLLNLDIMGSGEEGITVVNATKHPDEFQLLQKINKEAKLLTQVKSRGPVANSDHYWFSEKGVPAFFIYTMGPNKNYHDVNDTYLHLTFAETNDLIQLITAFLNEI
jgi:aminopeptidase YwaD